MVTFQCVDVPGESSEAQPVCCCSFFYCQFFYSTSVFRIIFITASFCVKDEGSQGGRKEGAACVHPGSVQRGGKPVFPLQRTSGERYTLRCLKFWSFETLFSCEVYSCLLILCLKPGALVGERVRCPFHGACFNVRTGDIEEYPGLDSLPSYKVKTQRSVLNIV